MTFHRSLDHRFALYSLRALMAIMVVSLVALCLTSTMASATSISRAAWKISLVAQPTNFAVTNGSEVDRYAVALTNTGGASSSGTITVTDVAPVGMLIMDGEGAQSASGWSCGTGGGRVLTCSYSNVVRPLEGTTTLNIRVAVEGGTLGHMLTDTLAVSGGGAPAATAGVSTIIGAAPPAFRFLDASSQISNGVGALDTQAGDRPFGMTLAFDFPQRELEGRPDAPIEVPRAMRVNLPAGLTGSTLATPQCRVVEVFADSCSADTRVGTLFVNFAESDGLLGGVYAIPVYNVVPERGYPAEFGSFIPQVDKPAFLYVTVRTGSDFGLVVTAPDIPFAGEVTDVTASFFGDPAKMDGSGRSSTALLTNKSSCLAESSATTLEADSWEELYTWVRAEAPMPPETGCDLLQFEPTISMTPEGSVAPAGEPSGYIADLQVPQSQSAVEGLATPDVRDVTVTLPPGLSLNPSTASGLVACPALGPEGINMTGPESTEPGPNGEVEEPRSVPGHCPLASQIGTVEGTTPALPQPLQGHVYVATPGCGGSEQAPCKEEDVLDGNLFAVYLELEGSGVIIKLRGSASVNPATGQVTAKFRELPQQPVSDIKLALKGGPRAPLANPQACGEALTTTDITPWSSPETPDADPSSGFPVVGCEGSPFSPSFEAGTTNTEAGAYTDIVTTISRSDRQQDLSAIQVQTPPGLLGMLSHVTLCGEVQANEGMCSPVSEIGTATVSAGAGSDPYWVTGKVYLTGPYNGAPFGLSVVVPAKAGPFNLGTVVTRAAITLNPETSAITITSNTLPQIRDGVPLRVQTINVTVNRAQFAFNPTSCEAKQVTGIIASAQGAIAHVSSPFAAGGCKNLPFNPGFAVSTRAPGSKKGGTSLAVKVSSKAGESNIHSVSVSLPKQLPSRLTTIQQACPEATFAANPAACPVGSLVGIAKGTTPALPVPIAGPAYLVSRGGAAFPNLELVLQGEGVRVNLTGSINIAHGITSSAFADIPDVPISSFELRLPEGRYSALTPNGSLCAKALTMPTTIVGQNGRKLVRTTKVTVVGCPKKAKRSAAKTRAKSGRVRTDARSRVASESGVVGRMQRGDKR
jgi:hypothetical protein